MYELMIRLKIGGNGDWECFFSGKQVNTHAEWEDWESLCPVGSKFHYFHDSKYSVKSAHTYIVIF